MPKRQNTDLYASSITSSMLYESTPPPQEHTMQVDPSQSLSNPVAANHHTVQLNHERADATASLTTSNVTAGESQIGNAAFITPDTTGAGVETIAGPVSSSTSGRHEGGASQTSERRRYPTVSSIDTNPSERRPVSPVHSLNRFISNQTASTDVTDAEAQLTSQFAESPKSYAAELGLFASATGGLSGWEMDNDDAMGDSSAVTVKPGFSSALTGKEGGEGNDKKQDDAKLQDDQLAELPHHPLPPANEPSSEMLRQQQQKQHGRQGERSDSSAVSNSDDEMSSSVPSRPPLVGRPSTPVSLVHGVGSNSEKPSETQNGQKVEETSKPVTGTDDTAWRKEQAENSVTCSVVQQSGNGGRSAAALNLNHHKDEQATKEKESLPILGESRLANVAVKKEAEVTSDDIASSRKTLQPSTLVDENSTAKDGLSAVKNLENLSSNQLRGHSAYPMAASAPQDNGNGFFQPANHSDGLDSRSRASLHRYIGMLHEEVVSVSTQERTKIFIDFVTAEALIRNIDLRSSLLSKQPLQKDERDCEMKVDRPDASDSTAATPPPRVPRTNQATDQPSVDNGLQESADTDDATISTSTAAMPSPTLATEDGFSDTSQEYSPGGRPIIKRPPRVERAVPRLSTPVAGQMITRRATALPESEEKISVDRESSHLNRDLDTQAFLSRTPSARKRAATFDALTPAVVDVSQKSGNRDRVNGKNDGIAGAGEKSATGSDVSSSVAIMTPPGSDVDEAIAGGDKIRRQQQQQQEKDQERSSDQQSSAPAYEPYAMVRGRLSMPPETSSSVLVAASIAGRKRVSTPLNKVHEQELNTVLGPASTKRRSNINDETRMSKSLSIAEPPAQGTRANSGGSSDNIQSGEKNGNLKTGREEVDDQMAMMQRKKPLKSLTGLLSLLPNDVPQSRTPSPLLQPIWDQIFNYPSLSSSYVSMDFAMFLGGRRTTKVEDFSWISNLYASFDAQSAQIRARLDIERQQRTEVSEQRTEQLFNDNEIGYADLKSLEKKFSEDEKEIMAKECRAEYSRFTAEVFGHVYGRLQSEIGLLMPFAEHHVRERFLSEKRVSLDNHSDATISNGVVLGLEALEMQTSSRERSSEVFKEADINASIVNDSQALPEKMRESKRPTLEEVLCLYLCIIDKIEGRHERTVQALTDRDKRYARSILEPLAFSSSVDYGNIGSKNVDGGVSGGASGVLDLKNPRNSSATSSELKDAKYHGLQERPDEIAPRQQKQRQTPQLRYMEDHFAHAAHSAALNAAQDRRARLARIYSVLLSPGPGVESVIHRAMECAAKDMQKIADAMRNLKEEKSAAMASTWEKHDERKEKETDANSLGPDRERENSVAMSGKYEKIPQAESKKSHAGEASDNTMEGNGDGMVGIGDAGGKEEDDKGEGAKITRRLIKRANQAASGIVDDSTKISTMLTSLKMNLLRAGQVVRIWESHVKSEGEVTINDGKMAGEVEEIGKGGGGGVGGGGKDKRIDATSVDVDADADVGGDEGLREVRRKLARMKGLRDEIVGDGEYLETMLGK